MPTTGGAPAPLKVEAQPTTPTAQPPIIWEAAAGGNCAGTACAEEPTGPTTPLMKCLCGTGLGQFLSDRRITISGFTDVRYTASNVNLNRIPYGMGFSYNQHLPQFNWVTVEKAVDRTASEATFGYRVDTNLYGSTYQYTLPRGLWNGQLTDGPNGNPQTLGIDPVQHYVEGYFPNVMKGLDVKLGRHFCRFGVESLNPTLTPLPSWSYAFTFNPYTHTGVFTELQVTDKLTVTNDFVTGNDVYFFDPASRFYWLTAVQYAITDKATARVALILGDNTFDVGENFNNPNLIDAVFTYKFGCDDKWVYNFEFLYGWQDGVPGIGRAEWYHYVNYLTYNWTEKFSSTARAEFFDDRQGQRTGFAGLYNSFTIGSTWKPKDWLMVRPEVRYDHHNDARPFDNERDFFGFTINGIVLW
jgi:hypothetical protein